MTWSLHPWFTRISHAAAHGTGGVLLATGALSGLAARKNKRRNDDRDDRDRADRNRDRDDSDRNRDDKPEKDRNRDRTLERENNDRVGRDGDGRENDRGRQHGRQSDDSSDVTSAASRKQISSTNEDDDLSNADSDEVASDGGGGNNAGNAGSSFFDSALATKARRRANDFDNPDREEEDGIFVDVDPEGESVYATDSISFTTGLQGVEILTKNITYVADPTPTPTPFPRLALPVRGDGFPFGQDFPFGDGVVVTAPTRSISSDPGDGGDNTMDFLS